jgi:hypothetical protein
VNIPVLDLRSRVGSAPFSGGSMPTSLTNPPSGNAFTPYSVSPRLVDHTVLPNPTKYCVTLTPNFLAGHMCPTSCSAMEATTPSANSTTPSV